MTRAARAMIAIAASALGVGAAVRFAGHDALGGALRGDGLSVLLSALTAVCVATAILLDLDREDGGAQLRALLSGAGAVLLAMAGDLRVFAVGLALLVAPLQAPPAPAGPRTRWVRSLAIAAVAPGLALAGAALIAGEGSFDVGAIAAVASPSGRVGIACLLAALGVALARPPALVGQPGADGGSPGRLAGTTTLPAIGAFGGLLRMSAPLTLAAPALGLDWTACVAVFAAILVTVPTLAALGERSLRRTAMWASLSQSGYCAMALASPAGSTAVLFALAAAPLLTLGLCAVVAALPSPDPARSDLAGLARRHPGLVVALAALLLAQAGAPFTSGFIAKLGVLEAALAAQLAWLAIAGALTSVLWAVIFLRIIQISVDAGPGTVRAARLPRWVAAGIAIAVLAVGVVPGPLLEIARQTRF